MSFVDKVTNNLEGVKFFSVGPCPGCETCGLSDNPTEEEYDLASESHFSWSPCDSCNSHLGGDRHAAHGYITFDDGSEELVHFDVCTDCLLYHANGDVPEEEEE